MERFFYQNNITGFLADSEDTILGALARNNSFDLVDLQRNAWLYEITFLKNLLRKESSGHIIFEYSIPRLGKRIDAVLLLHGIIFVLEFKVGAKEFLRQDLEQVWDYALDLKNFHEASRNLTIVPILVATDADSPSVCKEVSQYDDQVFEPILSNAESACILLVQGKSCVFSAGYLQKMSPVYILLTAIKILINRGGIWKPNFAICV